MSSDETHKWDFQIEQEKQHTLKLKTDISYANADLIYWCCLLADTSYGLGRIVVNDAGRKLGTREVFVQSRGLEFAKRQLTETDFEEIKYSISRIDEHLSAIKTKIENLKSFRRSE